MAKSKRSKPMVKYTQERQFPTTPHRSGMGQMTGGAKAEHETLGQYVANLPEHRPRRPKGKHK